MRRRSALAAVGGVALAGTAWSLGAAPPSGSASGPGTALAWGPKGCWVAGAGGLQRLPGEPAPGIAPLALEDGIWRVGRDGALERWQRGGGDAWSLAWRRVLAQPVHAFAVAERGRFALAAHGEQASVLDGEGETLKSFDGRDATGARRGAAEAVFALGQRRSFAVAWPALGEVWEIALDPQAPPIFEGWVHDYRMGEGIASRGYLGARRSPLGLPLPRMRFADARVPWIAGTLDDTVAVVHLDVRRRIAALPVAGARLEGALLRRGEEGAGAAGAWQWWLPAGDAVQRVDTARWQLLERQRLPGPVLALQEVGRSVWALLAAPGGGSLHALRDGDWRRLDVAGEVQAVAADARGERALVATRGPSRLLLLDAQGRTLERWALPEAAEPSGVALGP